MKFAVVGAGAIGGLLAARLAHHGQDVVILARGRNAQALRSQGLTLEAPQAEPLHTRAFEVVEADQFLAGQASAALDGVDAVLLAVKAHQVLPLVPVLQALLSERSLLVSMINGVPWWYFQRHGGPHEGRVLQAVDPGGVLAAAFDPGRVIGSIVYPAAELVRPGLVRLIEGERFSLGELDGQRTPRLDAMSQALMQAGFRAPVSRDIRGELWVKLWGNLSFNPLSALTHATLEEICTHPAARAVIAAMMDEAAAVATALGVRMRVSVEQRIAGAQAVGAHKTSMLQDVEAGRPLELQALLGAVLELGEVAKVPTPRLNAIYAAVALLEQTLHTQAARAVLQPVSA
jgi:2-dehydropantoate 2-reductase